MRTKEPGLRTGRTCSSPESGESQFISATVTSTSPLAASSTSIHYPQWAALLIAPADQSAAIVEFEAMARTDSNASDKNPFLAVINPFEGRGVVYLEFDLRDPNPE